MVQKKLFKMSIFLLVVMLFTTLLMSFKNKQIYAANSNDYPIVLVHGLYGWSKNEISSLNYWGGICDIEKYLNDQGFKTMTANVGNLASDWDRAVELYYFIKGGTVDYGAAHATKCGHERYGKTFKGIYPQWNENSKIHLIGHSSGGQTIRQLVELLKNGCLEERNHSERVSEKVSPLFIGGKNWVLSLTTIATPLNGSTLADYIAAKKNESAGAIDLSSIIPNSLMKMFSLSPTIDFKLDQWGLKRNYGETIYEYVDRVQKSKLLNSYDNALVDLTTLGAAKFNMTAKTYDDMYYFSFNGNNSIKDPSTGYYLPKNNTGTPNPSSIAIGMYNSNNTLPFGDEKWWKNDGTVNVISAQVPFGQPCKINDYVFTKGTWIINPTMEGWGHEDFIGLGTAQNPLTVLQYYKIIATTLSNLAK